MFGYTRNPDGATTPTTINAYDINGNLIAGDSFTLACSGLGFRILLRNYIAIVNLTAQATNVSTPEPTTLLLLGSGLCLIGVVRRKLTR